MSLRKKPIVTAAMIAANRRNSQKSTGPKTERGKAFVALNSMKHGRRAQNFRAILARAGQSLDLFDWILERICATLDPETSASFLEAEMTAREVWIRFWRSQRLKTYDALGSAPGSLRGLNGSPPQKTPVRIVVENTQTGAKLIFGTTRLGGRFFHPVRTPAGWFPGIMVWRSKRGHVAEANPLAQSSRPEMLRQAAAGSATAVASETVALSTAAPATLCAAVGSYGLASLIAQTSSGIGGRPDLPPDGAVPGAPLVARGSSIV